MWPSVLSQGRSVPLPVRSISRTRRSPQARNRLRPLARLIPAGSPHRSMSASMTRRVQHSAPLLLSIFARPHQDGLMRSWRADSLCLRMARSRNYPMLQKSLLVSGESDSVALTRFAAEAGDDGAADGRAGAAFLRVSA